MNTHHLDYLNPKTLKATSTSPPYILPTSFTLYSSPFTSLIILGEAHLIMNLHVFDYCIFYANKHALNILTIS